MDKSSFIETLFTSSPVATVVLSFIVTVLTSSVVATFVSHYLASRERNREARRDAHQAAVGLEEYARKCEVKIYEYHTAERPPPSHDRDEQPIIGIVPDVPPLPNNPRFLSRKQAGALGKLVQLPLLAQRKNSAAKELWEHTDDVKLVENFLLEAIEEMKTKSLSIAEELREEFEVEDTE